MKKKLQIILLLIFTYVAQAQLVGGSAFLQGTRVELGVSPCGTFGTPSIGITPIPPGYHNNVAGSGLGFVADAGKNGWSMPGPGTVPNYCGDYFIPGSPVEGFALQIDTSSFQNSSICGIMQIPGSIISYYVSPRGKTAIWRSSGLVDGKIRITATTFIPDTGIAIICKVELCNETSLPVSNVYYLRHVDPDNDQPWAGGSFSTTNTIVSQGNLSGTALVTATSILGCFLGLGSVDSRARVSHGGFSLPAKCADVYNATAPYVGTVGATSSADAAISLCFNIPVIEPYACACLNYAYVLNSADIYSSLSYTDPIINCGLVGGAAGMSTVTGKSYYDRDSNCVFDSLYDFAAPYQIIRNNDGTGMAMSDMHGNYTVTFMDTGIFTLAVDTTPYFNVECPDSGYYSIVIDSTGSTFVSADFGDQDRICQLPLVDVNAPIMVRCRNGSPNYLTIHIVNPSYLPQYGLNLTLHLSDSLRIDTTYTFPYTYLGSNNYSLDVPDTILPFGFVNLLIPLEVGCDSNGTIYSYSVTLTGENVCDTFVIADTNRSALRGSYDPNEKLVRIFNDLSTSYQNTNQIDSLSELEYIITFQNSGTFDAFDVRIHDLIDGAYLDPNSIVMTGSSHPCSFVVEHNNFDIYFNDINLPFGPESDPSTHGYFSFRIKQKFGNIRGTAIYNKANIFFDANPPINTDFAISTISRAPNTCAIAYTQTITSLTCMDDNDASIALVPTTAGAYTYAWSNGASTASINSLIAGTYSVTISNNFDRGCSAIRSFTIANPASILTQFAAATDLTACDNNPDANIEYIRTSGTDPITFSWSTGAASPSISNLASGTYSVTVCNSIGCCETNSYTVVDVPAPTIILNPSADTVCIGDSVRINASGASSYEWPLDNSSNNYLVAYITENITIKVLGENADNCIDSNEVIIYAKDCNTGISAINNSSILLYPNPTEGLFTISADELIIQVDIVNLEGKLVKVLSHLDQKKILVRLDAENSGLYFVKIYTSSGIINRKLFVK